MYIKSRFIKTILSNPNKILLENFKYLDLYIDLCKILNYLNNGNINKIILVNPVSIYYKILVIF